MDDSSSTKTVGGKCLRPIRNRRYSRKSFAVGNRPAKRLFTPEIKRFLKEWLIRRRDNPYPNREEKKLLAVETGLTYIQICNWFANWRRKLKNAGNERNRKTWGHLIKTYNNHAQGNVEQFSICSDDSIWGEPDPRSPDTCADREDIEESNYKKQSTLNVTSNQLSLSKLQISSRNNQYNDQCYLVSSTTEDIKNEQSLANIQISGNKYKNHIMEKYLKGLQVDKEKQNKITIDTKQSESTSQPVLLTKWLESAAKFQPQKSNYVAWNTGSRNKTEKRQMTLPKHVNKNIPAAGQTLTQVVNEQTRNDLNNIYTRIPTYSNTQETGMEKEVTSPIQYSTCIHHGQEEVEAAVALTRLAGLYRI